MPIDFSCPGCKKKYRVKDELAGRTLRCKACQTQFAVPRPQAPQAPQTPQTPPAPANSLLDDTFVQMAEGGDPLADPLGPATPKKPKPRKAKTQFRVPNLGIWWIAAVLGPLMLLFWPLSFASKSAVGMLAMVGMLIPLMLCGLGILGMGYRIVAIAGSEGGTTLFHVLFWTRSGRRFAYANWRHYKPALFMFLQGIGLFLAGLGMVLTLGDRIKEMRSSNNVAQNDPNQPVPMAPPADVTGMPASDSGHTGGGGSVPRAAGSDRGTPSPRQRDRVQDPSETPGERMMREHAEDVWQRHYLEPAIRKVGEDGLATVVLRGLPFAANPFDLERHIKKRCAAEDVDSHSITEGEMWFLVVPGSDLDAVAAKLDLGAVAGIDRQARQITVDVDKSRLPKDDFSPPDDFFDSEEY